MVVKPVKNLNKKYSDDQPQRSFFEGGNHLCDTSWSISGPAWIEGGGPTPVVPRGAAIGHCPDDVQGRVSASGDLRASRPEVGAQAITA